MPYGGIIVMRIELITACSVQISLIFLFVFIEILITTTFLNYNLRHSKALDILQHCKCIHYTMST